MGDQYHEGSGGSASFRRDHPHQFFPGNPGEGGHVPAFPGDLQYTPQPANQLPNASGLKVRDAGASAFLDHRFGCDNGFVLEKVG